MKTSETQQEPLDGVPANADNNYTVTQTIAQHSEENGVSDVAAPPPDDALSVELPGNRRRNFIITILVSALLLTGLLYWLYARSKASTDSAEKEAAPVVSVRIAKAERQTIAAETTTLGTIFPREQSIVSAKIGAQIKRMRLLKNQLVHAGDVIATLESTDLQAQQAEALAALQSARAQARGVTAGSIPQATAQAEKDLRDAQANVTNARALYERRRALYAQGGIALKDVEAAQLALSTAESNLRLAQSTLNLRRTAQSPNEQAVAAASVNQAQQRAATTSAQLSYATVRAPITGIVTEQFQFEGEYAAPGARLVTIADISEVIVKAQFADTVVAKLKVGDPATVRPTDLSGEHITGRVSLISRASDPLNRTVEVWVNLANGAGRLRAGGAAEVVVATEQAKDAIVVPASAVTLDASNGDAGTVMVVDFGNVAHETKVTVGIKTKDLMQIVSGLQAGETVVTQGNYALPDQTKVEINESTDDTEKGGESSSGKSEDGDAAGGGAEK